MLGIGYKFCLSIKFYGACQNSVNIYGVDTLTKLHYSVRLDEKQYLWLMYASSVLCVAKNVLELRTY